MNKKNVVVLDRRVLDQGICTKRAKMQTTSGGGNFFLSCCSLRDFVLFSMQETKKCAVQLCLKMCKHIAQLNCMYSFMQVICECIGWWKGLMPPVSCHFTGESQFLLTGKLIIPVVSKTATCVGTLPSAKCIDRRRAEMFRIYPFVLLTRPASDVWQYSECRVQ